MQLIDSRRLTGTNLHHERPGAIAQVRFADGEDAESAIAAWRAAVADGLGRLGWIAELVVNRITDATGAAAAELMFTAEVDRLYAAAELNEWALRSVDAHATKVDFAPVLAEAAREVATYARVMPLIEEARARGVPVLVDDERFSLGYGRRGRSWKLAEAPELATIEWSQFGVIPVAIITGTNGKTTTTRLLARMVTAAGLQGANTSTDGIYVAERLAESGDWTGPGAAREVLWRDDVDVALLETARGGLLRRGIEIEQAAVAVVTNVARDHMGDYGIHDLAAMARAKGLVARAVGPEGRIVLGAESPALLEWAATQEFRAAVEWVSVDPDQAVLAPHVRAGGVVWTVVDGSLVRRGPDGDDVLLAVEDVAVSYGGGARHNVANALSATAAAHAMGVPREAIVAALRSFGADPGDNPGRAHMHHVERADGAVIDLLIDFAHNRAGLDAVRTWIAGLGRATVVSFGMAGDRSDADLRALGGTLTELEPHGVVIREIEDYRRGRALGEVPEQLVAGLLATGFDEGRTHRAASEPESLDRAVALAPDGGLVLLLVHLDRAGVAEWLEGVAARPGWALRPADD